MRGHRLLVCIAVLVAGACLWGSTRPAATAPRATALICTVPTSDHAPDSLLVLGGPVAGRGWVDSEQAKGLIGKGSRLSLYALECGVLGTMVTTDEGRLWSKGPGEPEGYGYGLEYRAQPRVAAGSAAAYAAALRRRWPLMAYVDLLAAWTQDGSPPAWVKGEFLSAQQEKGSRYWRLAADWLQARGVPRSRTDAMEMQHVVRADIDGDGRAEVFLSFRSAFGGYANEGHSNQEFFSYLLMRRLRPGTEQVETVVLADEVWRTLWVAGFCDLDRDGQAEIIVRGQGRDYTAALIFDWRGGKWRPLEGWMFGA